MYGFDPKQAFPDIRHKWGKGTSTPALLTGGVKYLRYICYVLKYSERLFYLFQKTANF